MSQSPDDARTARIQKYKEERRKQLMARTATLFSANVTDRRPKKTVNRMPSEDSPTHLKSSSELNLNTASTSVPIRTTRASRLRAAAANNVDPSTSPKKTNNRSSSVHSLIEDDKTKSNRNSRIIDRDKTRTHLRRQSNEKENLKSCSTSSAVDKENGAIRTKLKHSINKNILAKDKSNLIVTSSKEKHDDEKNISNGDEKENTLTEGDLVNLKDGGKIDNVDEIFNNILYDKNVSNSMEKETFENLFHDIVVGNNVNDNNIEHKINNKTVNDDSLSNQQRELKNNHKNSYIPVKETKISNKNDNYVNIDNRCVVPKVKEVAVGGLLGAVCVRKVEKFSELLSNLCSPCEADLLFEDILVENGINGDCSRRTKGPECTPPCRRAQPSPRTPSTAKRIGGPASATIDGDGTLTKLKTRRSIEAPHPKTESSLPSSKISPKHTVNLSFGIKNTSNKLSPSTPSTKKCNEKRHSTELGSKPSCIPLSKKSPDKIRRPSKSPVKQESVKDTLKSNTRSRLDSSKIKTLYRSPDKDKLKCDSDNNRNDRRQRAQKESENLSEKYHYSKKRLTSLETSPKQTNDAKIVTPKAVLRDNSDVNLKADPVCGSAKLEDNINKMFTLHETVRSHTGNSRLSQEMDSLAALTKQTLDRVNKLSNNLTSNKLNLKTPENRYDSLFPHSPEQQNNNHTYNYGLVNERPIHNRGVTERLKDIDTAAQRLIDFEKQSAIFSDLNNDASSQNRRTDNSPLTYHTPVSILKRKSIHEDSTISNTPSHAIASPPVTFSPSVVEPRNCRSENRKRQGILKKRRSLDESQVARRRSCSPEVSFADDGSSDISKPILKNRRSSLEDVVRNRSPDGQIQGILKRKLSREEELTNDDLSHSSPEPHGILKRKSNSSSSSSTTSSHVSIAQAVLLAAAGGAEIVEEEKEIVRPILKKKSFSEERPCPDILPLETPKPILKKKSTEHDDHDFDLPKKPILKTSKKLSGDEGHASSFDLSEDDRSSRRPSLLRSKTSDHSGSECEATVRPILKQRGSSLTRDRSQSPRPRLSFYAEHDTSVCSTNYSSDIGDSSTAGPRRILNVTPDQEESYPSAVIRRRNLRPKVNPRSMSLVCDVNDELLSILNNRRIKVDENCERDQSQLWEEEKLINNTRPKTFPSIASRIKSMEQALTKEMFLRDQPSTSKSKPRDKERFKTQPVTIEEMRSIASSLEPSQASFQAFGSAGCSFPSQPVESGAAFSPEGEEVPERDPFTDLDSPPFGASSFKTKLLTNVNSAESARGEEDRYGEATFLDFENLVESPEAQQSLEEIEQEVNKVRVALDEDSRALEEDERQQEADNWSLNVSCDSGVYNRASSRDSGPHSGEELGVIESQDIRENHTTNSSCNDWSSASIERELITMDRERKSTENEGLRSPEGRGSDEDDREGDEDHSGFALGLVKSNSVVARASMWQQLQQQAKGTPKPLIRHSRSKLKESPSVAERFKTQPILPSENINQPVTERLPLAQSKSTANVLDRDEDDLDDNSPSELAQRMITPEVRGILKSGSTVVPERPKTLAKGESSEGLKDEGIDSSSDDESASATSVSSSEKSCSSSDSSEDTPDPKPRRFQRKNNKLKSSRTDSDIVRTLQDPYPRKIQLPGANELKERLNQAKTVDGKIPLLGKLGRRPTEENNEDNDNRYRRFVKKIDEPLQLGKLRRPAEKTVNQVVEEKPPFLKITSLNQAAKNKFFGVDSGKSIEELTAAVRKYIPPVNKSMSTHTMEVAGSGSDGESSGGREVRHINSRVRHRAAGGVQRSATHAEMPHRGGTIAERLAALQAAGANDWRARVCRLSPETEDSKAIERAKNRINESLNSVDDKKKVHIDENELGPNILADRRNKLETAAQGWRKRVPQSDASLFTVAGRLERDKVAVATPPLTPPPSAPQTAASLGTPAPNKFRSRKAPTSPTNGFASGPLRSASCAVVGAAEAKPKEVPRIDRESFKRSHSVSESISRVDENEESPGAEKSGSAVRIPKADDETFQAFFAPLQARENEPADLDLDLDAIDSGSRQLLASEWARRAKRERRHVASRNPLRALAARTDLRQEYLAQPCTLRDQLIKEKATANCGLAAEALAALASKEDFSNVALRSASATNVPSHGTKPLMLLHVKGRRRVQTRLVEPVHTNINRGDCFLLVTHDLIFLYIGLYANVIERNRSTDIALHIFNTKDLGCKNSTGVIKIDEQTKNYSNKHWNQFWSLLGVTKDTENYKPVEAGHADEDEIFESCIVQTNMCYEVIDDELVPIKEYWGQVPRIAMLHLSKIIVFDFGSEMYIWYGKNVPLESRRRAAQLAQELYDDGYNYEECHINPLNAAVYQGIREESTPLVKTSKSRPEWTILSKVTQHMETILFKEKFLDWPDYTRVIKVKPQENKTNSVEITPCDAEEMWSNEYQDPDLILEGSHLGRGTHYYDKDSMRHYDIKTKSVCKWVIREYDFQKVENDSEVGEFFSADSYIIRWEYQITVTGRELNGKPSKHNLTGRDRCAYFCWQGRDASSNEKGAAALLTVELDREKGPQVRVAQGAEPPAFLNLFQGNLIIHQGKKDTDKSRYKLFVTRGNVSNEAYLLQVPCSVRQLRSRGSLLLIDTEKGCLYIWHGNRSLKHTKNVAIELANKLIARKSDYLFGDKASDIKITEVKEWEEPKEVLDALGVANKQYYNSMLSGREVNSDVTLRLFHFTDLGGQFEANEVLSPLRHEHLVTPFPFEQKELYSASQPALFLVDDGQAVWLWQGWWPRGEDGELEPAEINAGVGAFAARWQALRVAALRTAEAYCAAASAGGAARGDVRVVAAGLEPATFAHLFDTWHEHDHAAEANIAHGYKAGEVMSGRCELSRLASCDALLPLAALQRRPLPDHVHPHHLERHLASPDFMEAFGMTKEEFAALPAWKQTNMKKDVGLF
ncbi:uncharacterized protein [Battus philenor]|uniref:uncharacterized protein isoform X2 n=1 Tax=Battus philenor TaxID=42288 RepID=UPI0035CFE5DA